MRDRPHDLLEHRAVDLLGQLLGQVPDAGALGGVDLAGIGLLVTHDDLEDRGLADTVATHERDPPARA